MSLGGLEKWGPGWASRKVLELCRSGPQMASVSVPEHSAIAGFRESLRKLLPPQLPPGAQAASQSPGETTDGHTHASRNVSASREQPKRTGVISTSLLLVQVSVF